MTTPVSRCRSLALTALLATAALAGEAPKPKPPETQNVKRQRFEHALTLKGVVVAEKVHEVAFRPRAWAQLVVDWAAPHGSRVKAGEVILSLEVDKLDQAIADAEKDMAISDLDFAVKKVEFETLKASVPLDVEAAERALRIAREDFERYQKIDRPLQIKSTEFGVKAAKDHLTYVKEELRQLEKMYKADELTEETEEIILQRQRNAVERTEFALEKTLAAAEKTMKVDIPRQDVAAEEGVARRELAHAKARAALAAAVKKAELEFEKLQVARSRAAEKMAKMKADREALVVKAPFDGMVYYGACVAGNWTSLNRSLNAGTALKPLEVAMTLVQPRPVFVRATVAEKDVMHCRPGLSGTATPVAFPGAGLPARVTSVSAVPVAPGNYEVKLSVDVPEGAVAIVPGMNCTVRLVAFRVEDAIVVPASAVHGNGKPFVYVRQKAGGSEKRPVTIGKRTSAKVQIADGLASGETIFLKKPKDAK
jgi:multidrug efflux pump subunit AcrA (membrane-fusion protein)